MKKWFDITDSDGIKKSLREDIRKRGMAFYDGDPEKGGKRIPRSESPLWNDLVEILTEVTGKPYVPTGNVEKMKDVRAELYLKHLKEAVDRRKWNANLEGDRQFINDFRQHWLEEEAKNIDRWKAEIPSDRPEEIIEIEKYFKIVNDELVTIREGTPYKTYNQCTSKTFRADLLELCPKCPHFESIRTKIQDQIVFQARQNKDILTEKQFDEYLDAEIKNAQEAMTKTHLFELQSESKEDPYRSGRILSFIWNKERIKALNSFKIEIESKTTMAEEKNSDKIQTWENRLRDFIYQATRYSIDSVYAEVRPGFKFSVYFQDHVTSARTLYEEFRFALKNELGKLANPNFYGIDLKDRFLPMINQYREWYGKNKAETERFGEYNPYASMLNVIESTENEILKYFPPQTDNKNSTIESQLLTERERVLIHCYQQKPAIVRGQTGYADYMKFARPGDRIRYPNDSERKANSLIRSIEKILPYLTETEKKQAQSEIETIRANFRN
ncbi:hypothetical protein ACFQ4C_25715 [Larkinella insperata]|uniref:Large polyvalent protein associated domain-containing protein n=1 Tax=Larkinella insperata TaxID=332158 RepID=A0ABW3QF52_9BACT|nr:hypothetical protein [Larkinella insperata]